jgi:hypothetical protein
MGATSIGVPSQGKDPTLRTGRKHQPSSNREKQGGSTVRFQLAIALAVSVVLHAGASAQDAASDVGKAAKDTSHATVSATKDTAHGTSKAVEGTSKATGHAVKKTGHGVKKGVHDMGHGVKKSATKTAGAMK